MKHIFMMHHTKKHHDFESVIHKVMVNYEYNIIYTSSLQASVEYIKKQSQKARFYAVGGDGTLNGLIQALVYSENEVVVIPFGTGNDFCRTLTKERNPVKLLKESLQLEAQKVDTILLNQTYYINAACFGLDSVIATHVHDTPHIPLVPESKSYIISVLQNVLSYKHDIVTIVNDGICLYHGPVTLCTLNNAQYYGGGFQIIPHAHIQDGWIDICIVDRLSKIKIPYMLIKLLRHTLNQRKEVHYFKVKEVTVTCQNSCNVDGEEMRSESYHFQIQEKSLNMILYK